MQRRRTLKLRVDDLANSTRAPAPHVNKACIHLNIHDRDPPSCFARGDLVGVHNILPLKQQQNDCGDPNRKTLGRPTDFR